MNDETSRRTATLGSRPAWVWLVAVLLLGSVPVTAQEAVDAQAAEEAEECALAEFLKIYRLDADESLKHVPPPRPEGIRAYWKRERRGFGNTPDQFPTMAFRWKDPDRLQNWSMSSVDGFRVRDLPEYLEMGIYSVEIEGEADLLETRIPGDWVYRVNQPPEKMVRSLEIRLQRMLKKRIILRLRDVERDVVVVRGEYRSSPVTGRQKDQVEIYAQRIIPGGGGAGGGSGTYGEFLKWVGQWIGRPVVNDVPAPPKGSLTWFYNSRQPSTKEMQKEDHDEALVLKHLQEQTGLTFTRERRKIPILFIERAK